MNVKQKWPAYTFALVALGMLAQLVASYAIDLWAARIGAQNWLGGSIASQVSLLDDPTALELKGTASVLVRNEELVGNAASDLVAVERFISTRYAAADPRRFWAWLPSGPETVLTSDRRCLGAVQRLQVARPSKDTFFIACEGVAMVGVSVNAEGALLIVGYPLDNELARRLGVATNAEAMVFARGVPIASSLLDTAGKVMIPDLTAGDILPRGSVADRAFAERAVRLVNYGGFAMGTRTGPRMSVGQEATWYLAARRVSAEGDIVAVLLVPKAFMLIGADYSFIAMSTLSVVLMVAMALLVWKLVTRFSGPVEALSKSARAVVAGDLTQLVSVPDTSEMGQFCQTYNSMLGSMGELMALQKRLAREAGRSEIATGILHNVGNVLNSVNVAVSVALDAARASKVTGLAKASAMLDAHADDLPAFFGDDPRGKQLVAYLSKLSPRLLAERDHLLAELDEVAKSVDHIKSIVAMQQEYAKVGGVTERCVVSDLLDDALRIEATSYQSHHIGVVKQVDARVVISIDKHRVLQILLNLLSNAKNAIVATGRRAGCVVIRCWSEGERVCIGVADDGVGIPEENQAKIFRFGFTTSASGHGFGLHNSANVAKELGGELRCESAGEGRGATFTLELVPK